MIVSLIKLTFCAARRMGGKQDKEKLEEPSHDEGQVKKTEQKQKDEQPPPTESQPEKSENDDGTAKEDKNE